MAIGAILLYAVAAIAGVIGFFMMWLPIVGLPLLAVSGGCYFAARAVQRKARELAVRRQLGG